jgi:glutathione S-transferase
VPVLEHGEVALGESLAISEYLAETFPTPAHPRIFPAELGERARARGVMSFLRTGLFALREQRPTSSVFGAPTDRALTPEAQADADDLLRVASHALGDRATIGAAWSIADADLALALMRLIKNGDSVPAALRAAAEATWQRPSVQVYLREALASRSR